MFTYSDFLESLDVSHVNDEIKLAAQGMLGFLEIPAVAITFEVHTRKPHEVLFAHGYCEENLTHLSSDFVLRDPLFAQTRIGPESFMTWQETSFENSYTAQRWLLPAGYRNGISIPVKGVNGDVLGSIHLNTFEESMSPDRIDAIRSLSRHLREPLTRFKLGENVGLTVREREVIFLIVEGKTNREIAELLFLAPRTVSSHVENILRKLHVKTRVDIAVRALRLGLA